MSILIIINIIMYCPHIDVAIPVIYNRRRYILISKSILLKWTSKRYRNRLRIVKIYTILDENIPFCYCLSCLFCSSIYYYYSDCYFHGLLLWYVVICVLVLCYLCVWIRLPPLGCCAVILEWVEIEVLRCWIAELPNCWLSYLLLYLLLNSSLRLFN